jgi:ribonuclease E
MSQSSSDPSGDGKPTLEGRSEHSRHSPGSSDPKNEQNQKSLFNEGNSVGRNASNYASKREISNPPQIGDVRMPEQSRSTGNSESRESSSGYSYKRPGNSRGRLNKGTKAGGAVLGYDPNGQDASRSREATAKKPYVQPKPDASAQKKDSGTHTEYIPNQTSSQRQHSRRTPYPKRRFVNGETQLGRYLMCVHTRPGATEIAVMEGRRLLEHHVAKESNSDDQIDGNIYYGRVINILPGMEAAFVDIGTPKNAVLYWGDVQFEDEEKDTDTDTPHKVHSKRIEQLLKHGQMILCQVTKNPIGLKGARLTQEITLAGRFVVLMPGSDSGGISKRIPDQERRRLRKFLDEVKPADCGIIVRTAAAGVSMEELKADVEHLLSDWAEIEKKMHGANEPKLLYSEPHLALKFIREEFNGDYRAVIIDDYDLYKLLKSYVAEFDENLAGRIIYYDAKEERLPIFEKYNIHEQVHKALDKKVWLNSGGSLIIEKTEALTVIDVNTGKNVGKSSLGETVYQNNLEAAREIARQLRLRDIGGIIVIDFIDMEEKQHRDEVVTILRKSLSEDKTPSQVYPISDLGLVEMTRKRIGKGLLESISEECPICHGTGFVIEERL